MDIRGGNQQQIDQCRMQVASRNQHRGRRDGMDVLGWQVFLDIQHSGRQRNGFEVRVPSRVSLNPIQADEPHTGTAYQLVHDFGRRCADNERGIDSAAGQAVCQIAL